jgi:Tfp pilus assembly protein PilN
MEDMVRFELERHLPYASEDASFDFLPLPAEGPGQGGTTPRRVVIAAADRRVIDGALRVAEEAKLRPLSLTVAAHNLPALVARSRRDKVLWIHRNGDAVEMLFLAGGAITTSRYLPSADEPRLMAEAQLTFGITRWTGCDAVWLSGDGAKAGTPTALTDLGAPVLEPPWTPRARALMAALPDEGLGAFQLAMAVTAARGARPLELLPVPLRPRRLTRGQLITAGLVAATVLLAIAAALVPGYRETRRLAELNRQITALDPDVRGVEQVLKELERKRKLLQAIEAAERGSIRPLPVLRELTDLLPGDAWLTLLTLDLKRVELTGQAAAAAALIPLLENSARFERVEFSSPVTRGRDREQFRIKAEWEGGPGRVIPVSVTPPAAVVPPAPAAPAAPPAVRPVPRAIPRVVPPAVTAPPGDEEDLDEDAPAPRPRPRRPLAVPPRGQQ